MAFPIPHGRPAIPANVKRQLRQQAGFGCSECGHPFFEYHHIVPWAEDQHFRPEDMMVLCPTHHADFGAALPQNEQRRIKARPKNIVDQQVRGQLFVNSQELVVNLAGGQAINTPNLLLAGDEPILSARLDDEGRLLISAIIHDAEGVECGRIVDNEWVVSIANVWDLQSTVQHARIQAAPRQIQFDVDARKGQVELRGQWRWRGKRVEFSPAGMTYGDNKVQGISARNCGSFVILE